MIYTQKMRGHQLIKRFFQYSIIILFFFVQNAYPQAKQNTKPIPVYSRVPFGDPFILLWKGKYYAYGTHSANGIEVFVSDDQNVSNILAGVPDGYCF